MGIVVKGRRGLASTSARRPAPPRAGGRAGVTLIEVLVTTFVLAIGFVGVASMVTYGTVSHRKAVSYTIAVDRASEEIERIREAGYLGANVDGALFPSPSYQILGETQVGFAVPELTDGQGYITIVEDPEAQAVDPDTGAPYENLKRVKVEIHWGGAKPVGGSYNISTLIANRP